MSKQGNEPSQGLKEERNDFAHKGANIKQSLGDRNSNKDDVGDKMKDSKEIDLTQGDEPEKEPTKTNILKKPWPLLDIKEPHENDVLYGRGGGTNHHPGNKRYRRIVESRKNDYITSKRLDKPLVALEIIKNWRSQDPSGRFLKQDESTGMWNDVGDKKAREKTSQALREKPPGAKQEKANMCDDFINSRGSSELRADYEPFPTEQSIPGAPSRSVGFSEASSRNGVVRKKIARATLMRDHSLGRDYINPDEGVSLEGFSWKEPFMGGVDSGPDWNGRNISSGKKGHHRSRSHPNYGEFEPEPNRENRNFHYSLSPPDGRLEHNKRDHPLHSRNKNNVMSRSYDVGEPNPPIRQPRHHRSHSSASSGTGWVGHAPYSHDSKYNARPSSFTRRSPTNDETNGYNMNFSSNPLRLSSPKSRQGNMDFEPELFNRSSSNAPERSYQPYSSYQGNHATSHQRHHMDEFHSERRRSDNSTSWNRGERLLSSSASSSRSLPHHVEMLPISPGDKSPYRYPEALTTDNNVHNTPPSHHENKFSYERRSQNTGIQISHTKSTSPNEYGGERNNFPLLRQSSSFSRYEREKRMTSSSDFDVFPRDSDLPTHLPPMDAADLINSSSQPSPYGRAKPNKNKHIMEVNVEETIRPSTLDTRDMSIGGLLENVFDESSNNEIELPLPQAPVSTIIHASHLPMSYKKRNGDTSNSREESIFHRKERPCHVKRATSNQNEEKDTKKDTKMVKRAGLNREHSITAFKLREAYRDKERILADNEILKKENHVSQYERDSERKTPKANKTSNRPSNLTQRDHSLALNKLYEASVGDHVSEDIFASLDEDAFDALEDGDKQKSKVIEPDLEHENVIKKLSYATNEIDLVCSRESPASVEDEKKVQPKIAKPNVLKADKRVSTIEFIENQLEADDIDSNWLDLVES